MSVEKDLLKEVANDLWVTVKKLRPELGKDERLQLVLKAFMTIGDMGDQVQAALIVGLVSELEADKVSESKSVVVDKTSIPAEESGEGRRAVRRRASSSR